MKLFDVFKNNKTVLEKTQYVKVYKVQYENKDYKIIVPRKMANKRTVIYFIDDTIYWEQIPFNWRLVGSQRGDKKPIYKFSGEKIRNTLFIVKGNPFADEGLDNGIFRSAKKYDENFVNCISYKKFKDM